MKDKFCKHWREYDDGINGYSVEFCWATGKETTCCGVKPQCIYPECFEEEVLLREGR